jgi:hypothetical protein
MRKIISRAGTGSPGPGRTGLIVFSVALGMAALVGYAQVEAPSQCVPGMISGMVDYQGAIVGTSCDEQDESQEPVFTLAEGRCSRT